MKNQIKSALLAAAVGVVATSTQAALNNGDLLIGFTSQSGNDLMYDLGNASTLTDGQTWDLSSLLTGFSLNTVNWGVIGDQKISGTGNVWTTTPIGNPIPSTLASISAWGQLDTAQASIFSGFTTAAAGQSLSVDASTQNSWNQQTITGALTTQYHNVYANPNVVGLTSDNFYQIIANSSAPTLLGGFSLAGNGVVTYTVSAVPEPSSYALFTVTGLLALCLRNHLRRKQS